MIINSYVPQTFALINRACLSSTIWWSGFTMMSSTYTSISVTVRRSWQVGFLFLTSSRIAWEYNIAISTCITYNVARLLCNSYNVDTYTDIECCNVICYTCAYCNVHIPNNLRVGKLGENFV